MPKGIASLFGPPAPRPKPACGSRRRLCGVCANSPQRGELPNTHRPNLNKIFASCPGCPLHNLGSSKKSNPGFERVGAGERRAEQRQETIEEAVVLDEIARHHRIGHGSANSSLTKRCLTASDQAGSLAARNISVKRSDMLVPTYSAPLRVAARRPSPLVTHRTGQRRLTVRNG